MSIQTEEPNPSGFVNQAKTHQAISNQKCSLNGYSVTPTASVISLNTAKSDLSKMTLEFFNKIVPVDDFVYEPAEEVITLSESNLKNITHIPQESYSKDPSLHNFPPVITNISMHSEPANALCSDIQPVTCTMSSSRSAALVNPLPAQQHGQTEDQGVQLTASFGSGESQTIHPGEAYKAEMDFSADPVKAKKTGKAAGKTERARLLNQTAGSGSAELRTTLKEDYKRSVKKAYIKAYTKAYKRALWNELNLSSDLVHAKQACHNAGQAAGRAAIARLKLELAAACGSGVSLSLPPAFQSKS